MDLLIILGAGTPTVGVGAGVGALITLGGGAGVGALITLGGCAATGRTGDGVCMPTLGVGAGVGDRWMLGGPPEGMLKIARRLSTASSWA